MLYINNARFLWRSIHPAIKESQPELVAAWKIGQKLWTRDYAGVYDAFVALIGLKKLKFLLLLSQAKLYTKRMFKLLLSAYSTISIQDAAQFLGMSEEESTNCDNNVKKYLMVMVSTSLDFKTSSLPKISNICALHTFKIDYGSSVDGATGGDGCGWFRGVAPEQRLEGSS
ncbi:hypothetical protein PVK06_028504 [Gossypium arboreum]|uniref:CSN8/PSMD8/EIF3K domain-containing protein n=1 Tax=Gossypium arboreum TaxID=29729 RepID=A0ABR0P367_GOSAR|nr:hypothetical protein PVK06_028504 [Gossypium arboreum]